MNAGQVDVVIPTYNGARLLSETLASVLAQTYQDLVVTVVDDGSTDETREVVKRYGTHLRHIYKVNGGQASARNLGCRAGSGEYVCFVDSDDLLLPNMLEVLAGRLSAEPRADVCYAKVLAFDGSDSAHPYAEYWRPFVPWPNLLEPLTALCAIHGSATLLRRRVFERHGCLLEDRALQGCEDWHFWLTLVLGGAEVLYVPSVLALYRQHIGASSAFKLGVAMRQSELARAMASMFLSRGIDDARCREFLALGIFAVALRWITLRDRARFLSLVKLARSLAPSASVAGSILEDVAAVDVKHASWAWLRVAEAYVGLNRPELAAASFNRFVVDASQSFAQSLSPVLEAMTELVRTELAVRQPNDASYLGHTARQLACVCNVRGDMKGREEYIRCARVLNRNDVCNDIHLAAVLAARGAASQAARIMMNAATTRSAGLIRVGAREMLLKVSRLLG